MHIQLRLDTQQHQKPNNIVLIRRGTKLNTIELGSVVRVQEIMYKILNLSTFFKKYMFYFYCTILDIAYMKYISVLDYVMLIRLQ